MRDESAGEGGDTHRPDETGPRASRRRQALHLLGPSGITAVFFVVLHRLDLLGTLPLPVLLGLLAGGSAVAQLVTRRWTDDPTPAQLHALLAVQTLNVTAIIYAIGWGSTAGT